MLSPVPDSVGNTLTDYHTLIEEIVHYGELIRQNCSVKNWDSGDRCGRNHEIARSIATFFKGCIRRLTFVLN
ncbi:MAG: hypothetical protein PUP92_22110 [Rhizonema sp. PD38]|nr:hypothetical protein [Rhizonema sp. PD38]